MSSTAATSDHPMNESNSNSNSPGFVDNDPDGEVEPESAPLLESVNSSYPPLSAPLLPFTGSREVWLTANQARTESRKLKGYRWIPVSGSTSSLPVGLIPPICEAKRQRKVKDFSDPGESQQEAMNKQTNNRKSIPTANQPGKRKAENASDKEIFENIRQKERKIAEMEEKLRVLREFAGVRRAEGEEKRKKSPMIARSQTPKSRPKVPAFEDNYMPLSGSATPSASRTGRVIKTPQHYTSGEVQLTPVMKKLGTLLVALTNSKIQQGIFNEPVNYSDPAKPFYALSYLETIKGPPMDFSTIRMRLYSGEYNEPDEFARDVRLVFRNAQVYNPQDSWIFQASSSMAKQFEDDFNRIINSNNEKKVKNESSQPYTSALPNRSELPVDQATRISQSPPRKPTNSLQRQQSAPARGRYSEALTQKEKQQLKDDIFKLPSTALGPVVEIISKAMPQSMQNDEDEMEIDIDKLDIPTLRELQDYIRKSLNALRKQAANAEQRANTTGAMETSSASQVDSSNAVNDPESEADYPGSGRPMNSHQNSSQVEQTPAIIEFGTVQNTIDEVSQLHNLHQLIHSFSLCSLYCFMLSYLLPFIFVCLGS
jgi:hypothetical protein